MQQRFLLQILLLAQHVSGTTMPIIRSSRVLYSGCCLWYFVLWFSICWSGVELRVMCPVCRMLQHSKPLAARHGHGMLFVNRPLYGSFSWLHSPIVPRHSQCWSFENTRTSHSLGLLWTSDRPVAETSPWQHTTLTTDIHAVGEVRNHDLNRAATRIGRVSRLAN